MKYNDLKEKNVLKRNTSKTVRVSGLTIFVLRDVDEGWRFTLVCFTISKFFFS